ncbi:MAG: GNAT family N-acetyltransferase, partial [Pseudanabaena sp.]
MNDLTDKSPEKDSDRQDTNSVDIREMNIDDIAPIFHLGEQLFTSDLYPYLY